MWELWRRSQALHCKPSDLLGFDSPIRAFYFDRGVWLFASRLESDMDTASERAKSDKAKQAARLKVMNLYLASDEEPVAKRFKDPAAPTMEVQAQSGDEDLGDDFFNKKG